MQEMFEYDINKFLTKEIKAHINSLEKTIASQKKQYSVLLKSNEELSLKIEEYKDFLFLSKYMKQNFNKITADKPDENGWYDSKQKKQFQPTSILDSRQELKS